MADAKVTPRANVVSNPRCGTPLSRSQDYGIDAVIRIDATIAALQAQRSEVISINRSISGGAR